MKRIEPVHINFEFKLSEVFGTLITQIQDDETYELYAFIVHQGTSANSGHYFTYARDLDSDPDSWHYFDDNLAGTPVPVFKASSYDDLKKDWRLVRLIKAVSVLLLLNLIFFSRKAINLYSSTSFKIRFDAHMLFSNLYLNIYNSKNSEFETVYMLFYARKTR